MQDFIIVLVVMAILMAIYLGKNFIAGLQFLFGDLSRPANKTTVVALGDGHTVLLTQHQDIDKAFNRLLRLRDKSEFVLPIFFGDIEQCVSDTLACLATIQQNASKTLAIEVRGVTYKFSSQNIPGQGAITYRNRQNNGVTEELPPILGDLQQAITETIRPIAGTSTDLFKLPTFGIQFGNKTFSFDARHLRGEEFVVARSVQEARKKPSLLPTLTGSIGDVIALTLDAEKNTPALSSADTTYQTPSVNSQITDPKIFIEYSGQVVKANQEPSGRGYKHFVVHLRTPDLNTIEFTGNDLESQHENNKFAIGDYVSIKQINQPNPNSPDPKGRKKLFDIVCINKAANSLAEGTNGNP
jgi:hypothetical protein